MQSPTKSQTLNNECNFKTRSSQPCQPAWFTNAFLCAVMTNKHKSKRFVQELKQRWPGMRRWQLWEFVSEEFQRGSCTGWIELVLVPFEPSAGALQSCSCWCLCHWGFWSWLRFKPCKKTLMFRSGSLLPPSQSTQTAQGADYIFLLSVCVRHHSHSEWNRII